MAKQFDKNRLVSNIYALAKRRNVSIKSLEAAAGVSSGYLSRIKSDDGNVNPGIVGLAAIADKLDVDLDTMTFGQICDGISATEEYFLAVIKKLINDTDSDAALWDKTNINYLHAMADEGPDENGCYFCPPPLITTMTDKNSGTAYYVYNSPNAPNAELVDHTYYSCEFGWHGTFYLAQVREKDTPDKREEYYELFIYKERHLHRICSSQSLTPEIHEALAKLKLSIRDSINRPHIDDQLKSILDRFLDPTSDGLDDDVPF